MPTPQIDPKTGERIPTGNVQIDPATGERITAPAPTPSAQPGLLENLLPTGIMHPIQAAEQNKQNMLAHPVRSLLEAAGGPAVQMGEGLAGGIKRSAGELGDAFTALRSGNPAGAAVHGVSALPIIGPSLVNAAEKPDVGGTGSYLGDLKSTIASPSAMGTLMSGAVQTAPLVLGAADTALPGRGLVGQIPSSSRAIGKFESLNNDLADLPVPLKSTIAPLQRATELGVRGGTLPKPVSDLLSRSQMTIDPTYPELRDYQSNLSDLSREQKGSMNGKMLGQVGKLKSGLYEDIYNATSQAGRGEDYASAMKEFAQAAKLRDIATKGAKYVGSAAAGAAGAGGLYKAYKALE